MIGEGSEDAPYRETDKMSARLAATITLLSGVLMIVFIACESAPASPTPTPADPAPPAPDTRPDDGENKDALERAQAELDRRRALWEANRADDYSFELTPLCFCPPPLVEPVEIRVEKGVVESVINVESGKAPEHDELERYVTIDGLFHLIQEAIDRKASRITVSYDSEIGYPTDASFDYVAHMADEEFAFTTANYSPVAATARVTGTITYRERIAPGPDTTVEVELLDVSLQDAPSITLAKVTIVDPGQVPLRFEIEYDPSAIDDRFTYAVQAVIRDSGHMLFINTTAYDVITRGNPTHVDMVLERVNPASPTPALEMTRKPAPVELVVVTGDHTGYSLSIMSGLPSGCVRFDGYDLERRGKVLDVTVTNLVPTGPIACTAVYGTHEGEVDLGSDFTAGVTYTVVVNGEVTNAFVARDPEWPKAAVAESPVRKVEVVILESFSPQYQVSVASTLPLGSKCSKFNGYDIDRRSADTIRVTVTHLEFREEGLRCTRDLPTVVTQVPLGGDFTSGEEYTVVVNGVTRAFTAQ